jgi:hypothetical protein
MRTVKTPKVTVDGANLSVPSTVTSEYASRFRLTLPSPVLLLLGPSRAPHSHNRPGCVGFEGLRSLISFRARMRPLATGSHGVFQRYFTLIEINTIDTQ